MNFDNEDLGTLENRANCKQESRMWSFPSGKEKKRKTKWRKCHSQLKKKKTPKTK